MSAATAERYRITPEQLAQYYFVTDTLKKVGIALFGEHGWRYHLAVALGVRPDVFERKWTGRGEVPDDWEQRLYHAVMKVRMDERTAADARYLALLLLERDIRDRKVLK